MTGSSEFTRHTICNTLLSALFFIERMAAAGNFMILSTGVAMEDMLTMLHLIIHPCVFRVCSLWQHRSLMLFQKKRAVFFSLSGLEREYNGVYLATAVQ